MHKILYRLSTLKEKAMTDDTLFDSIDLPIPPLRDTLDFIPVQDGDERIVVIRDASGFVEQVIAIPAEAMALLSFFDGSLSISDLRREILEHTGHDVDPAPMLDMVQRLDAVRFLDNARFEAHRNAIIDEFRRSDTRHAKNAGLAYPGDPAELRGFLGSIITPEHGSIHARPVGMIVPHIDLRIGPEVYAAAYRELESMDFDTYVILGTAHHPHDDVFIMTDKDFETPLGIMRTDREFLSALKSNCGVEFTSDDSPHMFEHSVEFQVLMLQHLFGNERIRVVPILCGSLEFLYDDGTKPRELERYKYFIDAMRQTISENGRRVCFIMSVDWSHIGRKFGDDTAAADMLDAVRESDNAMLEALAAVDYDRFYEMLRASGNATGIDGFSCISTFFDVVRPGAGKLFKYQQWHEEERESAVTFAALGFYAE
jgi:AmmeMemoRadiSam system protein B